MASKPLLWLYCPHKLLENAKIQILIGLSGTKGVSIPSEKQQESTRDALPGLAEVR